MLLLIRYPFVIVTVPLQLPVIDILNGTKYLLVTTKVPSYVAEPLHCYFEDQEKLLLYINKTVTHATSSRKVKTMPRFE